MNFIPPIFSRTKEDLAEVESLEQVGYKALNAEQKQKWDLGMIGALNASDLNRIENNCMFLKFIMSGTENKTNYKVDWKMTDFVSRAEFLRIYNNIVEIMYAFRLENQVPAPPFDTIEKLNKVEELLFIAHNELIENINIENFKTSNGEIFKTNQNENFQVSNNNLNNNFKTNNGEIFKTNSLENLIVFGKI